LKSQVFKLRLKASVEQVAILNSVGRLFQVLGAATENALSPSVGVGVCVNVKKRGRPDAYHVTQIAYKNPQGDKNGPYLHP